mgnify:CR=1 FL=1
MNEELIRQIVLKLLETPELQALIQQKGISQIPKGLILLEEKERTDLLQEWVQRFSPKYRLSLLLQEKPGQSLHDPQESWNIPNGVQLITAEEACCDKEWSHIFLPDCSPDTLAKSALGIQDTPFTGLIGWGIREGIPITLSTNFLGFSPKTPEAYRKMFQDYIQKLRQFGVNIHFTPKELPLQRFNKKLLTDHDALSIPEGTLLWVAKGTVISPLAKDTLKRRQIQIRVETEGEL